MVFSADGFVRCYNIGFGFRVSCGCCAFRGFVIVVLGFAVGLVGDDCGWVGFMWFPGWFGDAWGWYNIVLSGLVLRGGFLGMI